MDLWLRHKPVLVYLGGGYNGHISLLDTKQGAFWFVTKSTVQKAPTVGTTYAFVLSIDAATVAGTTFRYATAAGIQSGSIVGKFQNSSTTSLLLNGQLVNGVIQSARESAIFECTVHPRAFTSAETREFLLHETKTS